MMDVYWSITPEDPNSWVPVRSLTIEVEEGSAPYTVDIYVDGELIEDDFGGVGVDPDNYYFEYEVFCDVYDAHLALVDLNGEPLPLATVILEHPTGAVSIVTSSLNGTLTLVQVPGGIWKISAVYKNLWVKPYAMTDEFNVTTNIYDAVEYKFAFVDAHLQMVKWGTDDYGITGLNVSISWEGNATITGDTGTWTEDWKTTGIHGYANFTQVPAGIEIAVEAFTIHEDEIGSYPHFADRANVYVGPYENVLVLAPENYFGAHHVYIYDFKLLLKDVTGTLLPDVLPYTNASIAMWTFEYGNLTYTNYLEYYSINGEHLYIGGEDYSIEVYWAGVRVFNGTITIPTVTDLSVVMPEIDVNTRIYPVTFTLYDWKGEAEDFGSLNITVQWVGINMTWLNETGNMIDEDTAYDHVFGGDSNVQTYSVSIIYPDEVTVYMPVWMIKDVIGTPVTIKIETTEGTLYVPEDVDPFPVGCITRTGEYVNGTDWIKSTNAYQKLDDAYTFGALNFTGTTATHWYDIWTYDNTTLAYHWKVAAYDMSAVLTIPEELEQLEGYEFDKSGYTVDVYWEHDTLMTTSTTDENGVATFDIIFWGNNTLYYFEAYRIPSPGELPENIGIQFKIADDVKADAEETASEDDIQVKLPFNYYLGVQMLSATGRPLYHEFGTVKKALVYVVRYTSYRDAAAGTIAAFGYVDENGYVYMLFAEDDGNYTIRTVWLGVNVYDSYEKEMTAFKIVSPSVFYTAFTDVFDVTIKLTDDVGRPLAGVYYTFVGSGTIDYAISGETGTDGTFTAILVPKGDYILSAKWTDGKIDILTDYEMTIDENIIELPIKCKVYDVVLNLKTKRGTIMAAADVTVKYPDGTEHSATTDQNGEILFTQVPVGKMEIVSVTWMDRPITVTPTTVDVDKTGTYYFTATNVYLLTVKIYGARGQGLGPSTVTISPVEMEVVTDESGVVTVELPEGSYTIHVNYRGIEDEKSVSLTGDMTQDFRLDVFATILGRPFRTAEFFGELVLLPIVVAIIVYLVAYEYYAWRRRRVAVVPPPPTT
ncbi:MAG: hypothetical protein DRJ69_03530 [Thermoprotei archaeon]|nr:MAG: hypothetical protein DRJ69_03530 [Thermoprotei archaeon]